MCFIILFSSLTGINSVVRADRNLTYDLTCCASSDHYLRNQPCLKVPRSTSTCFTLGLPWCNAASCYNGADICGDLSKLLGPIISHAIAILAVQCFSEPKHATHLMQSPRLMSLFHSPRTWSWTLFFSACTGNVICHMAVFDWPISWSTLTAWSTFPIRLVLHVIPWSTKDVRRNACDIFRS